MSEHAPKAADTPVEENEHEPDTNTARHEHPDDHKEKAAEEEKNRKERIGTVKESLITSPKTDKKAEEGASHDHKNHGAHASHGMSTGEKVGYFSKHISFAIGAGLMGLFTRYLGLVWGEVVGGWKEFGSGGKSKGHGGGGHGGGH